MEKFYGFHNTSTNKPDEPAIWLQNVGWVKASPASSLSIGSRLMWNGGGISEVVRIEKNKTGTRITFWEKDDKGRVWSNGRTVSTSRLLAIAI